MTEIDLAGPIEPTPPELLEDIRNRVRAAGTSFFSGMRILPRDRRDAMYAIYAFCREVDDIADDEPDPVEKTRKLQEWRHEIDRLFAGKPVHPIARALLAPTRRYRLRRENFLAIIDGMEMDAMTDIRAPSLDELDLYCARVASAVGLLSVRAFGAISPEGDEVAEAQGRALQLTNILRDLAEDAARGRLYLPQEILVKHGITDFDPVAVLKHPKLPDVCADVALLAQSYFDATERAMQRCPRQAMRAARLMWATYRAILQRMVARGWSNPGEPVKLSKGQQIGFVLRYGIL